MKKKYWYKYYYYYCPVCGRENVYKERRYTPKPENYEDRHKVEECYDWCNAF